MKNRRNMTKLLSLFLTVIILMGTVPISGFALSLIDTITVNGVENLQ